MSKDELIQQLETEAVEITGQHARLLPADPDALQRADRRRARGFGGEGLRRRFRAMLRAANQIAAVLRGIEGAQTSRWRKRPACHFWRSRSTRRNRAPGTQPSGVQDVIGIAIGGREAGLVFEGDRRFKSCAPDRCVRDDIEALENLPVPLPQAPPGRSRLPSRSSSSRPSIYGRIQPDQPGKRQAAGRGDGQSARARHRLGC